MYLARIKYGKEYPAVMLGHLDTVYSIIRSARRAAWPFIFTRGHSPRVKLSASPPLSLGFSRCCEFIDISLRSIPDDFKIKMFTGALQKGLTVISIEILEETAAGINEMLEAFIYSVKRTGVNGQEKTEEITVSKENGGFRNPAGSRDTSYVYIVRKTGCILKNPVDLQQNRICEMK